VYFYEALFHLSQTKIPFGKKTYNPWRARVKKDMLAGRQIYYCGHPARTGKRVK
jgi:hypothetical protein